MRRLLAWFLRGECLRHAEPLFDRDANGCAVFRCPKCLATWPILPDLTRRAPLPAPEWPRARVARPLARAHEPVRPFTKRAA